MNLKKWVLSSDSDGFCKIQFSNWRFLLNRPLEKKHSKHGIVLDFWLLKDAIRVPEVWHSWTGETAIVGQWLPVSVSSLQCLGKPTETSHGGFKRWEIIELTRGFSWIFQCHLWDFYQTKWDTFNCIQLQLVSLAAGWGWGWGWGWWWWWWWWRWRWRRWRRWWRIWAIGRNWMCIMCNYMCLRWSQTWSQCTSSYLEHLGASNCIANAWDGLLQWPVHLCFFLGSASWESIFPSWGGWKSFRERGKSRRWGHLGRRDILGWWSRGCFT